MSPNPPDEVRWNALLGDAEVAATWGATLLGWSAATGFAMSQWWNTLTEPNLMCPTSLGCLPTGGPGVAMLIVGAIAAVVAAFCASRLWMGRPRTVPLRLTRVLLAVGKTRVQLSSIRAVGSIGGAVVMMREDGDLERFELGDDTLAREVAGGVSRRIRHIDSVPDARARAWMDSLQRLTP